MKRAGLILSIVIGAAIAVILSGLTMQSSWEFEHELSISQEINALARIEIESREMALAIRNNQVETYDRLVSLDREMVETMDRVLSQADDKRAFETLERYLTSYRQEVERFKSARSILRNSLGYLPELTMKTIERLIEMGESDAVERVSRLAIALSHTAARGFDLEAEIRSLDYDHPSNDAIQHFISHARVVARSNELVDRHIAALRTHLLSVTTDAIDEEYAVRRSAVFERLVAIGLASISLSTCLLIVMGGTLVALRRTSVVLVETNESLEETIRVRSGELAQAQKLESVGRLAAGVAHEINTPSQFVGDNIGFLQDSFGDLTELLKVYESLTHASTDAPPSPELIAEIRAAEERADLEFLKEEIPSSLSQSAEGIARITTIVRAMKEFSHPGSEGMQSVNLNRAVESTLTVASNEWKYVAEVETSFDPDLPTFPGLAAELNQVILNIIVNAAQAIEEAQTEGDTTKGTIRVTTRREDGWACLEISDTGAGMPEEVREHIFDPFFTTKEVGKGTGQGLSIARSVVVDKHGGTIEAESAPGAGTTFRIRIPLERETEENA